MRTLILMLSEFSEIQRSVLKHFSVEELEEKLMRKKTQSIWIDASAVGFIEIDEKLMDVVKKDYDVLATLEIQYDEMAKNAKNVLEQTRNNNILGEFLAVRFCSMGVQSCPWECTGQDEYGYSSVGSGHVYIRTKENHLLYNEYLKEHFSIQRNEQFSDDEKKERIQNLRKNKGLLDGAETPLFEKAAYAFSFLVVTDLTPHLIASHHFFQSGGYRTAPERLFTVKNTNI